MKEMMLEVESSPAPAAAGASDPSMPPPRHTDHDYTAIYVPGMKLEPGKAWIDEDAPPMVRIDDTGKVGRSGIGCTFHLLLPSQFGATSKKVVVFCGLHHKPFFTSPLPGTLSRKMEEEVGFGYFKALNGLTID